MKTSQLFILLMSWYSSFRFLQRHQWFRNCETFFKLNLHILEIILLEINLLEIVLVFFIFANEKPLRLLERFAICERFPDDLSTTFTLWARIYPAYWLRRVVASPFINFCDSWYEKKIFSTFFYEMCWYGEYYFAYV